jgi:spermidine synthase
MVQDVATSLPTNQFDEPATTATRPQDSRRGLFPTLLLLFFATGACALVYQQLWVRLLSLVFGVTVYAVSTVLASFFAGLALGSYVAGRLVDRARRPLRWYGVAEILVGLAALATIAALSGVERSYVWMAGLLPDSVPTLTVVRFILSFAVLLVPATLMGASLPIVVRSALVRSGHLGERVSLLYATNTAGAIAGTLVAGFWLIGERGLTFSFRLAAAVNIAVGLVAVVGSRVWETARRPVEPIRPPDHTADRSEAALSVGARRSVLAVFMISGFVSLSLEVVWFRVLVLYLESTTYAFTIMLATVLAGIALGSYLVAPLMRLRIDWLKLLVAAELALSVVALASLYFLSKSAGVADSARDALGFLSGDLQPMLVASALAILPTTLLLGFAFPIGVRLWTAAPGGIAGDSGRRIGVFYACNVAAGIAGSVVAGFVLVPYLGARRSLVVLAALLLASGVIVLVVSSSLRVSLAVAGASIGVFALMTVTVVPNPYSAALAHRYPGERPIWQDEGAQTTVSVHERRDGSRLMYLDGLPQASSTPDVVQGHRLIGSLPMAVHPRPDRALVIGLGGGVTAGGASAFGNRSVEVVELSSEVVSGSRFFADLNGDVVHRPNVHVRVDDGRNYLLTTDKKYDVITADIILPEHVGAGNLWSVDYWRLTREALADDGIMVQWIPMRYDAEYKLIMRSFLEVYPNATLWAGGYVMIGSKRPFTLDPAAFEHKLENPEARAALQADGIPTFDALVSEYTAGPEEMRTFAGTGPLLTDDRPRLEYSRYLDHRRRPLDVSPLLAATDASEIAPLTR